MSLLYSERLRILLAERSLRVLRVDKGTPDGERVFSWQLDTPASPDDPATLLAAVRAWLDSQPVRRRVLDIVLSDALVRYAVVPWSDLIKTPSQQEGFARLILEPLTGPAADWALHCSPAGYRRAHLACALPRALLRQIEPWPGADGLTVVRSVTPLFMQVFNEAVARLPDDGLLVVNGPDRCVIAGWSAGAWRGIRPYSVPFDTRELLDLVAREQLLQDIPADAPIACADLSGEGLLASNLLPGFIGLPDPFGSASTRSAETEAAKASA